MTSIEVTVSCFCWMGSGFILRNEILIVRAVSSELHFESEGFILVN